MQVDIGPVIWTVVGLALTVAFIFGLSASAIWLRTKLRGGGVYDLRAGRQYVVAQSFTDHHGGRFEAGERLTFRRHDYLPYHGGTSIEFEERTAYLQDEENADVLGRLSNYIKPAPR